MALAGRLDLPKSTSSVLVKELVDLGLLSRAPDADNERRLRIALTDQGRRWLAVDTMLAPDRLALALAMLSPETLS